MVIVVIMEQHIMEKIRYEREFILSLQFVPVSLIKPDDLPVNRDVILDKANMKPLGVSQRHCDSVVPVGKLNPRRPPGAMDHGSVFKPSSGETRWRDKPRRHFNLSVDVQLNKAKEAWKPSGKKQQRCEEVKDKEEAMTQDLLNRVRGILNKLTPQKFQQLSKQVRELPIDTEGRLKGVIDTIFEKAISEPSFSIVYAKLCQCLLELQVPSADKPGVCVNFRRLLLNRCKVEFDKQLNVAQGQDLSKEELDQYKNKARRCFLGNIKFIGELFKLKMMTGATMDKGIVSKLLVRPDEESLECLCMLITTIGKDMDSEIARPCMDKMQKIIKERKTSPRIRFMMQDLLDLERNKWVPRRGDQGPKTIEEVHKDAELEVQMEQLRIQKTLISGGRGSYPPRQGRDTKSWNSCSISSNNKHIKLGSRPATSTLDRVSDLQQRSSGSSLHSDRLLAQDNSRVDVRSTTENMKQDAAPNPPTPQTPTKPALTEEEVEKKSAAIIEEYLHLNDMKEALQCVQELNSGQLLFVFVRHGLEATLDRSAIARDHMGQLLYQLIKAGIMPIQQYYKGLQEILEVAEDMSTDIPHFWRYLSELITPMFHEGGIPMGQLSKTLIPQGMAGNLLKYISA